MNTAWALVAELGLVAFLLGYIQAARLDHGRPATRRAVRGWAVVAGVGLLLLLSALRLAGAAPLGVQYPPEVGVGEGD